MAEGAEYDMKTIGIFDSNSHISGGVLQARFYQPANGNPSNTHYFDWVTVSKGLSAPSGAEIDPHSYHLGDINATGYNITASNFCLNPACTSYITNNGTHSIWV